jgi:hypothetical protein
MSGMDPLGAFARTSLVRPSPCATQALVLPIVGRSGWMARASDVGKSTLFATRSTPLRGRRLVDPANPSPLELQAIRTTIEYHIKTLTRRRLNGDGADLDWFDDLHSLPLRRLDLGLRKRET